MAADYKAINLGQGFPGWCPPSFVTKALSDSTLGLGRTDSLSNQYCRSAGAPPLCRELAKEYAVSLGREAIDPMKEVLVTNGCSEALYLAMTGLLDPGDEVPAHAHAHARARQRTTAHEIPHSPVASFYKKHAAALVNQAVHVAALFLI
jgi:aspartate/methionine/tyrosine aminotransferase